jgi:hypothetical protein
MSQRHLALVPFALLFVLTACPSTPPVGPGPSSAPSVAASPSAFPVIHKIGDVMQAKRAAPAPVPAVAVNGVRYSAPHFSSDAAGMAHNGGYVEAVNEKGGGRVWLKEIYRYAVDGKLEGDVQDVFIVRLRVDGTVLEIRDEQGTDYRMPL